MSLSDGWEMTIGLEIHAQIISESKLFSTSPAHFGATPNSHVNFVDTAMPGQLPVLNRECVRQCIRTGLAVGASINRFSQFERKNYFYPDLPQGYQISQYRHPIVTGGTVVIEDGMGNEKTIALERIHIEQDAGKSIHDQNATCSYIDLNRSGVGLMEIVSTPALSSPDEAADYVGKIRNILRYVGSCDGNMQEGSLRVDANVSVKRAGEALGTRCEIKNLNSIRFLRQAILFEAQRQVSLLEEGEAIRQETRLFDSAKGVTRPMRSKEEAHDYRYFPEPDLPPLIVEQAEIDALKEKLPELPDARKARLVGEYDLNHEEVAVIIAEKERADFFEKVAKGSDKKLAANWVVSELLARLNKKGIALANSPVSAEQLCALVNMIKDETISARAAKQVFDEMFEKGGEPADIVEKEGLRQMQDDEEVEKIVRDVIEQNPEQCVEYREGREKVLGWLVGQVMKLSAGKANPAQAGALLKRLLDS